MNRLHIGRLLCFVLTIAIITACGDSDSGLLSMTAQRSDVEFRVRAEGEIIASEALPIALPSSIRMRFNIVWLAPEFSEVKKGDVIVRFDDAQVSLDRDATSLNVAKSEFRLADTRREGQLERTRIGHEALRVDGERDISEAFSEADESLFSRNDLIDILADLDYLDVEASFLDWQFETLDQRNEAELNLILAEQQGEKSKLEKQETALDLMELRSPADGTFVYAQTAWGGKMAKGRGVHPGMPIGLLPVKGKVRLRLFVPEADAVGLEAGQLVRFRLDAAANDEFTARIGTVSPVASPRDSTDPQKFFRVEAEIDRVDPDLMRVGSRLRADIVTETIDDGVVIPFQAVHGDAGQNYVFVLSGNKPQRREVELGRRSPDLVELVSGIEPGDRISLVTPAGET